MDRRSFGVAGAINPYRMNVSAVTDGAEVSISHILSGEADLVRWQARRFDVIKPPSLSSVTPAELFLATGAGR